MSAAGVTARVSAHRTAAAATPRPQGRLRLAYLVNQYPAVSHTFVRRELRHVERLGHSVLRLTIRGADYPSVDDQDREEERLTIRCVGQPWYVLARAVLATVFTRPLAAMRGLRAVAGMFRKSDRGAARHAAYWVEAAFLLGVLRRERVQHVHVHFGTNAAGVMRLARTMGGPTYSITFHGPVEWDEPRQQDVAGKVQDALFVTAISHFASAQLRRWSSPEVWDRIHIVRCTVDDAYLAGAPPIDPRSNTLVMVGRLAPEKGLVTLIEAFAGAVRESAPASSGWRLVLVGDGPLRPYVEKRSKELGIDTQVEVTGWQSEEGVRRRLIESRGLVLPSFSEGLPVVIMEALALERPVIATYVGAVSELVVPGESGWLVPAGDVHSTRRAITELLSSGADRLAAMGRAGRAAVEERHRTSVEAGRLEGLFRRYVGESDHGEARSRP